MGVTALSKKPQEPLPDFMPAPDQHSTRRRQPEAAHASADRSASEPKRSTDRRAPKPSAKK
jgi:hypothetical protein